MNHVTDCVEKENCEQEKGCTTIIKQYYGCGHNDCCESNIGDIGQNGKSAYELAIENGFEGSLEEWLISLQGIQGEPGIQGMQGIQGAPGQTGAQGIEGLSIWTTATQLATSGNTSSVNVVAVTGRTLKAGDLVLSSHESSPGIMHRVTTVGTLGTASTTTTYVGNIRGATGLQGPATINYSAMEQFTGNYWIDGKKIYQKTVQCGLIDNLTGKIINHSISNISNIVELKGLLYGTNPAPSFWLSLPAFGGAAGGALGVHLAASATDIYITTFSDRIGSTVYVTLLYTCTNR